MKKIVIVDLWTDANKGDEALQVGLVRMLRDKHPKAEIIGVFRFDLNEFDTAKPEIQKTCALLDRACGGLRRTHYAGDNAAKLKGARHILFSLYSFVELAVFLGLYKFGAKRLVPKLHRDVMSEIADADVVVWKGKNFRSFGGIAGVNRQATLLVAGVISRILNPRVFCVNASIWKMGRGFEGTMVASVLRLFRSVSVRDSGSQAAAREMGLKNVFFAHDLSFYYLKTVSSAGTKGVREKTSIALTVTKWGSETENARYVDALVASISALADEGVRDVYIVPQVTRKAESNEALVKRLVSQIDALGKGCAVRDIRGELSIDELLAAYSRCSLLIGTRMHSCVFARFVGTPFVGIAYDDGPKWDILREFWPAELIVPYSVGGEELKEKCLRGYRNGPSLLENSEAFFKKLPELSFMNVKDIV